MDKEELKKMLKEHLTVKVSTRWVYNAHKIFVDIFFDGEKIASGCETLEEDDDF